MTSFPSSRTILSFSKPKVAAIIIFLIAVVFLSVPLFSSTANSGSSAKSVNVDERISDAQDEKSIASADGKLRPVSDEVKEAAFPDTPGGWIVPRDHSPTELSLSKAQTFDGDLRSIAHGQDGKRQGGSPELGPLPNFDGLDRASVNADWPPDTSGDVGPTYFIQAISSAVGIFNKSSGSLVTSFSMNTFMGQGNYGNLCDTANKGNPTVLYDTFEGRWIITDFAYTVDGSNNINNPPGAFQCIAVSKTGDPVSGGWYFYSINRTDFLNDSPKFGIWTDGLYMSANMVDFAAARTFRGLRVWAFNKDQMYEGAAAPQIVTFSAGSGDLALLPSNARLQTGTPPPGTPGYFISSWNFLNALTVYKFKVDWIRPALSTFTGPDTPLASTSWPNAAVPASATPINSLDSVQLRAMAQARYTNFGGAESLWLTHTVRRANTTGFAAPRWYEVGVTGGTVAANITQATTWDPDGANVTHRFLPSLAIDRAGNMALGYSASNSTTNPSLRYAGRLSGDPINTFSQSEQILFAGTGTQSGICLGATCTQWGEYSAMTLDPNGCTFWYTNEYYAVDGTDYRTRIGSFRFSPCTDIAPGSLEGTVTTGGNPVSGTTVSLGKRKTMTDGSGHYSFTGLPAGTYPVETAAAPGYMAASVNSVVVAEAAMSTQNFSLTGAPASACLTDTTEADFQIGTATNVVLTPGGDVTLPDTPTLDQQNTNLSTSGVGITVTTWGGQTFTPSITGTLTSVEVNMFCSGCIGTTPNLTLSLRATSGGLPTGADIASATITGFSSAGGGYFPAIFAAPPTVNAGTVYAFVIRPVANPSSGTYALTRSATDVYVGGQRVTGATSGTVWSAQLTSGQTTDAGFLTYIRTGYSPSGDLVSGLKDANPASGSVASWANISWNASVPPNTTLRFQAAGSNDTLGTFNFVGPDGTSGTFYTNGGSLSQFDGFRYLRYKAIFNTTDPNAAPTLNDVTICFANQIFTSGSWTGATDTNWNTPTNWSPAIVPQAGNSAVIPSSGVTNEPTIPAAGPDIAVSTLDVRSGRTLTIQGGRTLAVTNGLTDNGTINNAGGLSFGSFSGSGALNFTGSTQQTVPAGTFSNLAMNNPAGAVLGGDVTINTSLTLTNGNITTNGNILSIGASGSISRTSGHIIGNLRKVFGAPPPLSQVVSAKAQLSPAAIFTFPVGTANGFSPVTLNVLTGTGSFTVSATQSMMAGTNPAESIQRYWTITPSGSMSANITLQYLDIDVPGGATEAGFKFLRKSGASYGSFAPSTLDTVANTFTLNGVTAFSDWSLGNLLVTAASVPVAGRVTDSAGRGIGMAVVTISNSNNRLYQAKTNPFGYYSFENVPAGETYFVSAKHKLFTFTPQVVSIGDAVFNLNIVALP